MSEIRRFPKKNPHKTGEFMEHHIFRMYNDSFENMRRIQKYFEAIARGGHDNIQKIKTLLQNDPKQHFYETSHS